MKILRIIYDFPPPWQGLAPFPYELSLAQVENGDEVTVICGLWPKATPKLPELPKKLKLLRLPREILPHTLFFTTAPLAFFIILKELAFGHYDVIQGHGQLPLYYLLFRRIFPYFPHLPAEALAKEGVPYYHFLHITAAGRREEAKKTGQKIDPITKYVEWPLHEWADRLGVKIAKYVFVTGENVKTEAMEYYKVPEDKITVLEKGVNPITFSPNGPDKRRELGFNESDFVLFGFGYSDRKQVHITVQSLTHLPENFKLMIVGDIKPEYQKHLNELIDKHNLTSRVVFTGPVSYLDIADYYRTSNLHVLPSTYEGFPKSVLESLACGVPVLASGFSPGETLPGFKEIKNTDPENLAQAIKDNKDLRVDREFIIQNYSWSKIAEKII